MKMAKILPAAALLAVLILIVSGCSGVAPGKKAPDFSLNGIDGETYSLSDYEGRPVVLNFFATWCGPCQYEVPHLEDFYTNEKWREEGVVFLAIDIGESSEQIKQFMDYFSLTFPVLLDQDRSIATAYNVSGIPVTFFIDKHGIIQNTKTGAFTSLNALESMVEGLLDQ